jgi:hypothetical protein
LDYYTEPARKIPVYGRYDVVVAGGGCAGLAAAIASARNGAKTLIIERFPFFGGTATASLMSNIVGIRNQGKPDDLQVMKGIGEEIILSLLEQGGAVKTKTAYASEERSNRKGDLSYTYSFDPEKFKTITLKMVRDAGCDILFHAFFSDVIMQGDTVSGIVVEAKSCRMAIYGKVIVDASGDADVAARAGVPCWQTKHEEAPRLVDCLMYRVAGVDPGIQVNGCAMGETVVLWGPSPGPHDGVDPRELTDMEISVRTQVAEHFTKLKKENPAMKNAYIIDTGSLIGIRQSRFIKGDYVFSGDDVINGAKFYDSIAMGANPIIHIFGYRRFLTHEGYEIPYRCLLPLNVEGLLVAGRCISTDQTAYESWRAMATILPIGEAAGTAAALSAMDCVSPRALDIAKLQRQLIAQGAEIGQNSQNPIH